jgi:quinolinate synthase
VETIVRPGADAITVDQLDPYLDYEAEIDRLRRDNNAVILAHYYQDPEIQDLADFIGDSLDLSRKAAATDADIIVFCGVRFMGEVAKILSPTRTVLLPDADAGCSLEDSCPPDEFKAFREKHPDHIAVTYINCSAEVKALSDVIVTSANAESIVRQLPADKPILFAPDQHLGNYVARQAGRDLTFWPGSCIVHDQFSERELLKLKSQRKGAAVIAHPECAESVLKHADHVGSTRSIIQFARDSHHQDFIVATELHIIHELKKQAPNKTFTPAPGADGTCNCANCPFMAMNTLEKLYLCMINNAPRIEIPEDLRIQAKKPLDKMLEMTPPAASLANSPAQAAAE